MFEHDFSRQRKQFRINQSYNITYLSSNARTTVKVASFASKRKTARVLPEDPTSPEKTHRAVPPSRKLYDGDMDTPLLHKNKGFGIRMDPFIYSMEDSSGCSNVEEFGLFDEVAVADPEVVVVAIP